MLALSLAAPAHAASTSIPRANQPLAGPAAALERLAQAYRDRSVAGIDAVLTDDFRFHTVGDSLLRFTLGSTRETELRVVRGLLEGVTRDGRVVVPRADSVGMSFDGVSEGVDPEHPDSTQHYEVLTVTRAEYAVRAADGTRFESGASLHVFHVVRGDAAVLAPGQSADRDRWYVRRWLEDVTALNRSLRERKGVCGDEPGVVPAVADAPGTPTPPGALGVRALANPACARLTVTCDLPGSEPARVEVYDVSGRRVNTRRVEVRSAGGVTMDAGAGAKLLPGIYWVRLGQGARRPSTRMVIVAN